MGEIGDRRGRSGGSSKNGDQLVDFPRVCFVRMWRRFPRLRDQAKVATQYPWLRELDSFDWAMEELRGIREGELEQERCAEKIVQPLGAMPKEVARCRRICKKPLSKHLRQWRKPH